MLNYKKYSFFCIHIRHIKKRHQQRLKCFNKIQTIYHLNRFDISLVWILLRHFSFCWILLVWNKFLFEILFSDVDSFLKIFLRKICTYVLTKVLILMALHFFIIWSFSFSVSCLLHTFFVSVTHNSWIKGLVLNFSIITS